MFTIHTQDMECVIQAAARGSFYTVQDTMKNGFITINGGHRLGICGTAVMRDGEISYIKNPSSVSVRIAHEINGVSKSVMSSLFTKKGVFLNTLIVSPPAAGKTTLLRDVVRELSDAYRLRVSLVDERSELAAPLKGMSQYDVGRYTDVLEGCPKAEGMMIMLRSMSPDIMAVDEITAPEDVRALTYAGNCGCGIVATIHGDGVGQLLARPLLAPLWDSGIFQRVTSITMKNGKREYNVSPAPTAAGGHTGDERE